MYLYAKQYMINVQNLNPLYRCYALALVWKINCSFHTQPLKPIYVHVRIFPSKKINQKRICGVTLRET